MVKYPEHLIKLIEIFRKFPSVGTKSAERFAFALLNFDDDVLKKMGAYIAKTKQAITFCTDCGAMEIENKCMFCTNVKREQTQLCVVSFAKDVFAIEDTHQYTGLYHVLGAQLTPIDDFEEKLDMQKLKERLQQKKIKEVILALDSTLEGDATALFLKEELRESNVQISRLAFGLPLGSSLDFVDSGTLSKAVQSRLQF